MSQGELSRQSGLHRSYLSGIERGGRNVSLRNILTIASTLEVTASQLLRGVSADCGSIPDGRPKSKATKAKTATRARGGRKSGPAK
jgi:transcriptional regulator with XRE-family HTH domain